MNTEKQPSNNLAAESTRTHTARRAATRNGGKNQGSASQALVDAVEESGAYKTEAFSRRQVRSNESTVSLFLFA